MNPLPYIYDRLLIIRRQQPEVAVVAAIEHIYLAVGSVYKCKEVMIQQFHLQGGFFCVKRLGGEALYAYHFGKLGLDRLFRFCRCNESTFFQPALQPGAMAADLTLELAYYLLGSGQHVVGGLFAAQQYAVKRNGDLGCHLAAISGDLNGSSNIVGEIAIELAQLFLSHFAEGICEFNLFGDKV